MTVENLFYMVLLALIVLGTVAMYGFLLTRQIKAFWHTLIVLRDKIDGTKRCP